MAAFYLLTRRDRLSMPLKWLHFSVLASIQIEPSLTLTNFPTRYKCRGHISFSHQILA